MFSVLRCINVIYEVLNESKMFSGIWSIKEWSNSICCMGDWDQCNLIENTCFMQQKREVFCYLQNVSIFLLKFVTQHNLNTGSWFIKRKSMLILLMELLFVLCSSHQPFLWFCLFNSRQIGKSSPLSKDRF